MEKTIVLLSYEVRNIIQQNQIQSGNQKFVDENRETLLFVILSANAVWFCNFMAK